MIGDSVIADEEVNINSGMPDRVKERNESLCEECWKETYEIIRTFNPA